MKEKHNKTTIRDFFWNLPEYVVSFFTYTRPLGYILLFLLFAGLLTLKVIDSGFLQVVKEKESNIYVEGTIGRVGNLNPIFLTQNQVDKDLRQLLFQKFISVNIEGEPVEGIAKSWEIDESKKIYTFKLNDDNYFHDGVRLTARDVKFTFDTAIYLADNKNSDTIGKSLSGVLVEVIDDFTIKFTLSETNATFYEAISVYIIPQHYFGNIMPDQLEYSRLNDYPIGSGPYYLFEQNESYLLLKSSEFFNPKTKIEQIEYRLYPDFESLKVAFQNNTLTAVSNIGVYEAEFAKLGGNFIDYKYDLPVRQRLIYMNNRHTLLGNASIRRGLAYITDRERLVNNASISGSAIFGPYDEESWVYNKDITYPNFNLEQAQREFKEAGYTYNSNTGYYESSDKKILAFKVDYLNNVLNERIVNELKEQWEEQGVILVPNPLSYDQIFKETISTRNFELLLYEVETTVDPDQYNLWHSLKIDYPNLNLAGYKFNRADILLERARKENDKNKRADDYKQFTKYLMNDSPVLYLYRPDYHYYVSKRIKNINPDNLIFPADRFNNIFEWEFHE